MPGLLKKIITGCIVTILSIALIVGAVSMYPRPYYKYAILFEESISTIGKHSQVYVGSMLSGYVDSVKHDNDNWNNSIVIIKINRKIDPNAAFAKIAAKTILGSTSLIQITISDTASKTYSKKAISQSQLAEESVLGQIPSKSSTAHDAFNILEAITTSQESQKIVESIAQILIKVKDILSKIEQAVGTDDQKSILSITQEILNYIKNNISNIGNFVTKANQVLNKVNQILNSFKY